MKVSREQAAENRERVLAAAGRLFRENGFHGIGVADIMRQAGLTHGGFYGQFASKDDLAAQACARVLGRSAERWTQLAAGDDPLAAIVNSYLSTRHRDAPGGGCALATLSAEAARQPRPVRTVFTGGLRALVDILTKLMPGRVRAARHRQALVTMSGLVGAIMLSRAVDDPELSDEILQAAAKAFGGKTA